MKKPDERALRLVTRLANALAEFHGEEPGNFACHFQAATILIGAGPLRDHEASDFFTTSDWRG